jgi:hypothetical protein
MSSLGEHATGPYAEEARERWGNTDAYRESQRRTSSYSTKDWQRVQAEGEAVVAAVLTAMQAGLPANSAEAMAAAELHRRQIDDNFYPCSYEMQINLAEMYLADERFADYYDRHAAGLAKYLVEAIYANARAQS